MAENQTIEDSPAIRRFGRARETRDLHMVEAARGPRPRGRIGLGPWGSHRITTPERLVPGG